MNTSLFETTNIGSMYPTHALLHASTEEIDVILKQLATYDVGTEGLLKLVTRVGYLMKSVGKSFAALVVKLGKRSEFELFNDKKMALYKAVEAPNAWDDIKNTISPIPAGMTTDYITAITCLGETYGIMDPLNLIPRLASSVKTISTTYSRADENLQTQIEGEVNYFKQVSGLLKDPLTELLRVFSTKHVDDKPLHELFANSDELRNCRLMLASKVKFINTCRKMNKKINVFGDEFNLMASAISHNSESIDKNTITMLIEYGKYLSLFTENYGAIILRHMALEHNLIQVYYKQTAGM